ATAQDVPSQCSVSAWNPASMTWSPTAHASVAETASTPLRPSTLPLPGLGLGTTVQDDPSQRSVRVFTGPVPSADRPTAHASHGDSTVTPSSSLSIRPG